MAKPVSEISELTSVLKDVLVVQLLQAGIGVVEIRQIVAGDNNRISRISKHFAAARRKALQDVRAK